ncbi:hypothetical protein SISSUDRAFT_1120655 [Sistotremastrum suecicum HHB10207 ss-3]|uniref:Uncharacterized protein n=1 Tax=Sistotremastrum suecicum HHB10207 ss-3 TaxID=1314776 RepID=A0A166BZW6_9AGAM|nr:hypothetical protein SISSUDRAFT_1120655 [Sistotremastrum suecicum HHB10207 ss-3]
MQPKIQMHLLAAKSSYHKIASELWHSNNPSPTDVGSTRLQISDGRFGTFKPLVHLVYTPSKLHRADHGGTRPTSENRSAKIDRAGLRLGTTIKLDTSLLDAIVREAVRKCRQKHDIVKTAPICEHAAYTYHPQPKDRRICHASQQNVPANHFISKWQPGTFRRVRSLSTPYFFLGQRCVVVSSDYSHSRATKIALRDFGCSGDGRLI